MMWEEVFLKVYCDKKKGIKGRCLSAAGVKLGNNATINLKICAFLLISNRQFTKILLRVTTVYDSRCFKMRWISFIGLKLQHGASTSLKKWNSLLVFKIFVCKVILRVTAVNHCFLSFEEQLKWTRRKVRCISVRCISRSVSIVLLPESVLSLFYTDCFLATLSIGVVFLYFGWWLKILLVVFGWRRMSHTTWFIRCVGWWCHCVVRRRCAPAELLLSETSLPSIVVNSSRELEEPRGGEAVGGLACWLAEAGLKWAADLSASASPSVQSEAAHWACSDTCEAAAHLSVSPSVSQHVSFGSLAGSAHSVCSGPLSGSLAGSVQLHSGSVVARLPVGGSAQLPDEINATSGDCWLAVYLFFPKPVDCLSSCLCVHQYGRSSGVCL